MRRFAIILSVAIFIFLSYLFFQRNLDFTASMRVDITNCYKTENRIVRGDFLLGLTEPNQTVKVLFGYYSCNKIERGDIVAYNYAGDPNPIIKIVRGIPGDKFSLQKTEGGWNIIINGETVKNSKGEPYGLSESGSKMLLLYERDYKGIIPADAYLILGNLASGSLDSSRFGLVGEQDILGKVEY